MNGSKCVGLLDKGEGLVKKKPRLEHEVCLDCERRLTRAEILKKKEANLGF